MEGPSGARNLRDFDTTGIDEVVCELEVALSFFVVDNIARHVSVAHVLCLLSNINIALWRENA